MQLAVGEFLVIEAVGVDDAAGPLEAPFRLGRADSVSIVDGDTVVDTVAWVDGDAPEGQSWGRLPDGTGDWGGRRPTRLAPNAPLEAGQPESLFPTEVVTLRLAIEDADWTAMQADPEAGDWVAADLDFGGIAVPQVAVRPFGGGSLDAAVEAGSPRYPLRVDLNRLVAGQSLFGKKKFELDNGHGDASRLRVALTFQLFREFGVPAPQTAFADVYVNDTHIGLYTLIETIDGDFVDQFEDNDGDLYQPELPASALGDLGATYAPYADSANIERNSNSTDHSAFLGLIGAINRGGALAEALDIDVALRYLAVNTALVNLDSYQGTGADYWLYADAGIFKIIPWDVNQSFGAESCGCRPADIIGLPIEEPTCGPVADRPLIGRLFDNAMHLEEYRTLLTRFIDVPAHPDVMRATIMGLANRIRPFVEADPTAFTDAAAFEQAVAMDGDLMGFIEARAAAMRAQLAGEAPAVGDGMGCTPPMP
jgi:spore coat protein CotH